MMTTQEMLTPKRMHLGRQVWIVSALLIPSTVMVAPSWLGIAQYGILGVGPLTSFSLG